MKSIKCKSCGLVNFAGAEKCKRCQQPLSLAPSASPNISNPAKDQAPAYSTSEKASKPSDLKAFLKLLPIVLFGVPMALVLKDRMFDPPAKAGGNVDTLQLTILAICTIGLIVTGIVWIATRKK